MSIATLYSRATLGLKAPLITIETHISKGLPGFSIVGLPETAIKESRDRIRSALINSQFELPIKKITVNLAPADLPKQGSGFDLPIALSILIASKQIEVADIEAYEFIGELALSGELRPVLAVLPVAMAAKEQNRTLMIPTQNAVKAGLICDAKIFAASHILEICAHLCKRKILPQVNTQPKNFSFTDKSFKDMQDLQGQPLARRAMEIAACGGHSLLLYGPPGTGKSMIAQRLPGILPPLNETQALHTAAVYSISTTGFEMKNWRKRPFRAPHHSASAAALVGGGSPPKPGEISLAHNGVLFLDELPEFNRHVLETLREPMETGKILLSRAAVQREYPAAFQLIAAMNPCPCGYAGDSTNDCNCTSEQIQRYRGRISGPLLDRIDMQLEMSRVSHAVMLGIQKEATEDSLSIKKRVIKARDLQLARQNCANANLSVAQLDIHCALDTKNKMFLAEAIDKLKLSARSFHRILRLARTIADLDNKDMIAKAHLLEALSFRKFN